MEWDFHPGEVMVRKFTGEDAQEKIQLRIDLGVLQMNAQGRPDGQKPHGHATLLDYFHARKLRQDDPEKPFKLSPEDCLELQREAAQFHHRCLCYYQMDEYEPALADARHNCVLFKFLEHNHDDRDFVWGLLEYRPQVIMMRCRASSALAMMENDHAQAAALVEHGIEEIREFFREYEHEEFLEDCEEINTLVEWLEEIRAQRPLSERERLEIALNEAVKREDYEKAAEYRDALRNLGNTKS